MEGIEEESRGHMYAHCPEAERRELDPGSNLCLLDWQVNSLPLSHLGSPISIGSGFFTTVPPGKPLIRLTGHNEQI